MKKFWKRKPGPKPPNVTPTAFDANPFPLIRKRFPSIMANTLVSVQPMTLPTGLIFAVDSSYNTDRSITNIIDRYLNDKGTHPIQ